MKLAEIDEYKTAISIPQLVKDPCLANGHCVINSDGSINMYTGGYCIVFPYITPQRKYAVRCWYNEVEDAELKAQVLTKKFKELALPYFLDFEYVPNGIIANAPMPIVRMEWANGVDLRKFVTSNLGNRDILERVLSNFVEMVKTLHKHNISHGDLQHGNILVKPDGSLLLVDYDSMYVDELKDTTNSIAGLAGFQHPSRINDTHPSPKADYFSELVIYITLKATIECPEIWTRYKCDKDSTDLIFKATDFDDISKSVAYNDVYSISDDMAKLVVKLKESCTVSHYEMLKPLEEVIESLGVTTIVTENYSSIFERMKTAQTAAKEEKLNTVRSAPSIDFTSVFSKMKQSASVYEQQKKEAEEQASKEAAAAMTKFAKHYQSLKNNNK